MRRCDDCWRLVWFSLLDAFSGMMPRIQLLTNCAKVYHWTRFKRMARDDSPEEDPLFLRMVWCAVLFEADPDGLRWWKTTTRWVYGVRYQKRQDRDKKSSLPTLAQPDQTEDRVFNFGDFWPGISWWQANFVHRVSRFTLLNWKYHHGSWPLSHSIFQRDIDSAYMIILQ